MVPLAQLWLPIVLSAILVFVVSSIVHMVIKWHNGDYRGFANEDEVRQAIRKSNPAPGQYMVPYCQGMKDLEKAEMQQKFVEGPIAFLMVRPSGLPKMGASLTQWFVLTLVVSIFVAYLGSHTLAAGSPYLVVFRVTGTAAFLAYAGSVPTRAIWQGEPWPSVTKHVVDGLAYALVTAGTFGWLWPKM